MASNKSKTGSSRRKGDEYQDLTALQLALELYIQRQEYRLYIEYEKAGSLDDVVIEHADRVDAYQVKYAVNPNEVYVLDDFTNPNSKVYFKKFSDSWLALKKLYPSKDLTLHLFTNRALDAALSELITAEGYFIEQFIKGKKRKRSREIHQELQTCTQLHDYEFQEFLACFHFQIRQLTLPDLVQHIQGNLLDHELGISDRPIYHDLKEIIEDFAINKRDALTPKLIDEILRKTQSRYLLPQKFEVDKTLYVERDELKAKLNTTLKNVDGDYIVVTGLPGSGKSTALTVYFDEQEQLSNHTIIRYYCFVDINDNFQKRRVEARSLRVNLLSILQDKFHDILPRHFDYSEDNFYQMLKILGEYFKGNNQRLIILIDGLDHAERMESEIQESLIKALPTNVPKGAVIVVGTQELHKWPLFLKKSRENPNTHIELSLFALDQTKTYLIDKKQLTQLSEEQIQEIHRKSEGLPLYLRYITERISDIDDVGTELGQITRIPEGNIKNYYEMLWQEFVSLGRGNIRHLCGVLACLRFPLHKNELFSFQKELSRPDFDDCFQFIKHLLKQRDNQVEIFHNSFREFILSKLDSDWIHTIYADITDYLKSQKGSNLWFSYVFEYAYRANDYDYVLNEVNREFVDYALNRYRPNQDIENAIYWAAESAKETSDILTLSSLGALKSRTKERIEYHLDRNLLSKTLLAMGKEEDVLRYSYSLHFNEWLIDFPTALNLLKELPNQNKWEIGEKLFSVFEESFYGAKFQDRSDLLNYSYCLGIYDKSLTNALKWLSQIELKPDILETLQPYAPDYAPHLEVYLVPPLAGQSPVHLPQLRHLSFSFSQAGSS
ncbi:MAG: dsDNA nuclease domain-containing protein [Promethearchaeota archaeon]